MPRTILALLAFAAAILLIMSSIKKGHSFGFDEMTARPDKGRLMLWATYYYMPVFQSCDDGIHIRGLDGKELGPRLKRKDWCRAAIEGSFTVFYNGSSGSYNYGGRSGEYEVDCSDCISYDVGMNKFTQARGRYGDGVHDYVLVPFRTIAVDSNTLPYGSVIYIPAARGTWFFGPDGVRARHDGYFFAGDTGGAIRGSHIDVYFGLSTNNPFTNWLTSSPGRLFEAFIVTNSNIISTLRRMHTLEK